MSSLFVTSGDAYVGSRALQVTVVDPDGSATDLTGIDLTFLVKQGLDDADADAVITKTVGTGITVAAPLTGMATIDLSEADTADRAGMFPWELQGVDANGRVTLASGSLYISPDLITG